jgi:hypothetical protein
MASLIRAIDILIYLSVALGAVLLPQLYGVVPAWLFYSVLGGWLAYVLVAMLAATRHRIAYVFAFVLSILTLLVSIPQPEHRSFVMAGLSLASITFLLGSALQLALLILIPFHFIRTRRKRVP